MRRYSYWLGLALAITATGGCRDDGKIDATQRDPITVARDESAPCVEFGGLRHCQLGNALLTPHEEGRVVEVTNLAEAGRDGISVQLPDVTNYAPEGRIDGSAPGSTLSVRAMSGGHTIGTMSLRRVDGGYEVSAAFTGDGNEGTYRMELFNGGEPVGMISNIQNGGTVAVSYYWASWWWWWWWWHWVSFWNVRSGPLQGECVFAFDLERGDEIRAVTDDGREVVADRIELHEDVRGGGSYPYLTFDRMDYTIGGGRMLLTGETIENRKEP